MSDRIWSAVSLFVLAFALNQVFKLRARARATVRVRVRARR
jgi:hypothetical protein